MQGIFRRGFPEQQEGSASDAGNGFLLFVSTTGAEFTIRAEEFTAATDTPAERERKRAIVASWPRGCLMFKLSRPRNGGAASLMVKRTPASSARPAPRTLADAMEAEAAEEGSAEAGEAQRAEAA